MPMVEAQELTKGDHIHQGVKRFRVTGPVSAVDPLGYVKVPAWPLSGGAVVELDYYAHYLLSTVRPIIWEDGTLAYVNIGGEIIPCKVVGKRTHRWVSPGPKDYVVVKLTANRTRMGFDLDNKPAYVRRRGDLYQFEIRDETECYSLIRRDYTFQSSGQLVITAHEHDFSQLTDLTGTLDKHKIQNW